MHLSVYMAQNNLSDEQVAAGVGKTRVSVSRYRRRLLRPGWKAVRKFEEWSGGAITGDDWAEPLATEMQAAE